MFGLDLSDTKDHEHGGVTWKIGAVPWAKLEALRADFLQHLAELGDAPAADAAPATHAARRLAAIPLTQACGEVVRWGVKGWDLAGFPFETRPESFAGQSFPVLTDRLVDLLCRVDRGLLVEVLAIEVFKANAVSEEDLVGFR